MKKITLLFAAFLLLTFLACEDDEMKLAEVTAVQLAIKADYDGQTFMTEKDYEYNGMTIQFSKFDFYLSDLVLTKSPADGGGEIELSEVEFVDLTFNINQQALAEQGVQINASDIETGDYSGLRLGVGVKADLNRLSWTDFASGHPLRNDSHYWVAWNSFIFAKLEGRIDADNDGTFENTFVYHTGADEAYTEKTIGELITLEKDQVKHINLSINVKELLKASSSTCDANADGFIDIEVADCSRTHSDSQFPLLKNIMDNFRTAISMN